MSPLDSYKSDDQIQLKQTIRKGSIDLGTDMEFPGGNLEFDDKLPGGEIRLWAGFGFRAAAFGENGSFVFPSRQMGISFEGSLETSQVSKAHFKSDVTDRLIAGLQNVDGLCHPKLS